MKRHLLLMLVFTFALNWQGNAQFTEDFEGTFPPTGWTIINDGDANGWIGGAPGSGTGHSGTKVAKIVYSSNAHDDWMITPSMSIVSGTLDRYSFWAKNRSSTYVEKFNVLLSTTGTAKADFTVSLATDIGPPTSWTKYEYDLTPYVGQTVYVAIQATSTDEHELDIDDAVADALPACPAPTALAAGNFSLTDAELTWTTGGATDWEVVVQAAGAGAPAGSGTAVTGTATYTAMTLTGGTDYEFYVRDFCNPDYSAWVGPVTWTQPNVGDDCTLPILAVAEADCATATPISLDFANAVNETLPSCDGFGNSGFWIKVTTPVSGAMTINNTGSGVGVSIYDGCGGTEIFCNNNTLGATTSLNGFTPNADVYCYFWKDAASGTADICFEALSCPFPTALAAANLTTTGADLSWTIGLSETNWDLYIVSDGSTPVEATTPTMDNHTATSLTWAGGMPSTEYKVWVRADCSGDNSDVSVWAGPVTFTTLAACPVPTGLAATNITATEAVLAWTTGGATAWEVVVQAPGAAPTGSGTVATNPYTAMNLTAETAYEYYVRDFCNPDYSEWAGPFSFTTPCVVMTPDYVETFTTFVPSCWMEASNGDPTTGPMDFGSGDWVAEEFAHASTTGSGAVNVNLYNANTSDWVLSPTFDLSTGGYELRLDVALTNYNTSAAGNMGSDDEVQLLYTEDGTTWINLMTWNAGNQPATAGETVTIALSSTGTTVQFGIWASEGTVDDTEDCDFHFDNFLIQTPPTALDCASIVAPVDAGTVPLDDVCTNELILGWAPAVTGVAADSYDVYFGPTGSMTLLGTVAGTETTQIVSVVLGSSYEYEWQIVPKDANGNMPVNTCPTWSFTVSDPNSGQDAMGAGSGGYVFANDIATGVPSVPTYSWIDPVAAGHTEITAWTAGNDDDGYFTVPDIGFAFPFYGTDFQTGDVHIGSNGNIQFGASAVTNTASTATIPNSNTLNNWIAVLAMDLDDGTDGKVYYGMSGGNLVVTWWHYIDFNQAPYMTFQVILFNDGNGSIKMQYNDLESTNPQAAAFYSDGLIGIENADGSDGIAYLDGSGNGGPVLCSPRAIGFSTAPAVLPIELSTFSGKLMTRANRLAWTTETERNGSHFEIERAKSNGLAFETIGRIDAKGNSNAAIDYSFEDKTPSTLAYYRLKMVDLDGTYKYSDVISLLRKDRGFGLYAAYPVPTSADLTVEFTTAEVSEMTVILTDLAGRALLSEKFTSTSGIQKHEVNMSTLAPGTYFMKLSDGQQTLVQRVVKQ